MSTRILIIAHAPLASALRDCAMHVFPDCAQAVVAIDVPPYEPPEDTLATAMQQLQSPQDTLVLTDVMGATDRKSTRLNSSHIPLSRMPSSA